MIGKIKFRLYIVSFLSLVTITGLGALALNSYEEMRGIELQLLQADKINLTLNTVANSPFYKSIEKKLNEEKGKLYPDYRSEAYNKIVNAYKKRKRGDLNRKIVKFRTQEKRYLKYLKPNIKIYEERLRVYMFSTLGCFILATLLMLLMSTRLILKPIKGLSTRMVDFLNHRYTYKFRVPKKNEVGELELNFHSLAQRVLNNIEELKTLDAAKTDFLNIASHELRTPLTSIKGSLSLIRTGIEKLSPDKVSRLVQIAEGETDRLIRLINDLLDLAKIEAGKLTLEKKWASVDSIIEKTLYSLEGLSKTSNVMLSYKSGQSKIVDVDEDKIQQVITNLASNAIKYSPKGGVVLVSVEIDHSNHLKIGITDQGEGISPEDQKLIFEKFRQASGPTNPIVKGTGLGLAIVKAVVEEHNGIIGVNSKVGKGSTFYFTLPDWKQEEVVLNFSNKEEQGEAA